MKTISKILASAALALALSAPAPGIDDLLGQSIRKFRYPSYDAQGQLKMEVAGDTAQVMPEGLIRITSLKMTFYEEGKTAMMIVTPVCFYDRMNQTASSEAPVTVTRPEIMINGTGFEWSEKSGSISIRSNTRVLLRRSGQRSYLDSAPATAGVARAESTTAAETNVTVITSRSLSFNQKTMAAVFEGGAVVSDPELNISSDSLTVEFTDDKKVKQINADGNVVITRDTMRAYAKTATYALQEGKITLWGKPTVMRQKDNLTAESIVFWRDSDRIICEPNAHLVIYSDSANNSKISKN